MLNKENIIKASENLGKIIKRTPLLFSPRLSKKYGANIYLKREDLQPVRSYKIRGAYNLISNLNEEDKQKGIICASAGNHAQGVAFSCQNLKVKGTIFMPVTTPEQKVYKTKQFWGEFIEIKLIGDTFDESLKAAYELQKENGAIFVHPFDDKRTMEWQSTIGLEIYQEMEKDPDIIICPIGWWGVISWTIETTEIFGKNTKIIGAEPAWAPSMQASLNSWENQAIEKMDIFVDGAAVQRVGNIPFEICKKYKLQTIACPENRICSTILEFLREDGIILEPAWALAPDALKDMQEEIKGKTVVLILSGGNFDFERLPEVKERSMQYEGRKRYYIINLPQRPWALKDFLWCLWPNDDIARFEYMKKANKERAPVIMWIESDSNKSFEKIEENMEKMWIKYQNITDSKFYCNLLIF